MENNGIFYLKSGLEETLVVLRVFFLMPTASVFVHPTINHVAASTVHHIGTLPPLNPLTQAV